MMSLSDIQLPINLDPDPRVAIEKASIYAPYLARLADREAAFLAALDRETLSSAFEHLLSSLVDDLAALDGDAQIMSRLRLAKRQAHLLIASADLSGCWPLFTVTKAMTRFAEASAACALQAAARLRHVSTDGLFLVALGKMGAYELNYSSDIDIAALYDPEAFDGGPRGAAHTASRIIKQMTAFLETPTADGYVFRTDLRLRPDPRSTPVAVSTKMAINYYEGIGQNWERMVWIKGRPFAGDLKVAEQFLDAMTPFVWRQHLDYWAIQDIHAIKGMINASTDHGELDDPHADIKLAPGGIREIEFFAQTQQLIYGGRDPSLRQRDTIGALSALAGRGHVDGAIAGQLTKAYTVLRAAEHRIQMRLDEQTHTLPEAPDKRFAVAALCGYHELGAFDRHIASVRHAVYGAYGDLFERETRAATAAVKGNLVFTGVDKDPGTVKTLTEMGFDDPGSVIETIQYWHRGRLAATRTERGREILTALLPSLLDDMSKSGDAGIAFRRFATFIERLPSGVQTLSMLMGEPRLRRDLVSTLALAPRLASAIGREPHLIEALLQPSEPLKLIVDHEMTFEEALDLVRRHVRERVFLIGYNLLHGQIPAQLAGLRYSDLADETVACLANATLFETERRFGAAPGPWCIAALGKLGGRAMTAGSDLDLMVLYESRQSEGAARWFTRFTQRLITALSVETAEGGLYEVDMRLRPSGRAGPVAVSFSSFARYHREESWTWELMALTRFRTVAGDSDLCHRADDLVLDILKTVPHREKLTRDIHEMRQRLARDKPGRGLWDLKLGPGGLVDLEFIVQRELLLSPPDRPTPVLSDAIDWLAQTGAVDGALAADLRAADDCLSNLQQIQRLALIGDVDPDHVSGGLAGRLARAIGVQDFEATTAELKRVKTVVMKHRRERIGATDMDASLL